MFVYDLITASVAEFGEWSVLPALIYDILIIRVRILLLLLLLVLGWQKSRLNHQVSLVVCGRHSLMKLLLVVMLLLFHLLRLLLSLCDSLLELGGIHVRLAWRVYGRGRVSIRLLPK